LLLSVLPAPGHPSLAYPGLHLRWRLGWLRGWLYRPLWRLRGHRVTLGKRFSLQGEIRFSGPGQVIIGDDVIVDAVVTPFTHSADAVIRIGSRTFVNGTRFGCALSIEIGEECILADARLMDTDFHAVSRDRNLPGARPAEAPVRVGRNVWISAGSAVLKGVEIGDDSVIAFGAVVVKSVASGKVAGGNPAKEIADVPAGAISR